ncbi:hypothetical protein HYW99_00015 [Candidatus Woesearchaeota archaeon]|nr:hypothetical protein [Candidatus Woesearchaeota archaeon]
MVEGIDLTIENLKIQLNEIKQKISQCRKKGLDTKIAELKMMLIPSKIKMAEITRDYKEVQKINNMLNDAKAELENIEKENLNSENETSEGKQLEEMHILIVKIEELLNENKIKEAKDNYLKCINFYKKFPENSKKELFERLNDLRVRINRD